MAETRRLVLMALLAAAALSLFVIEAQLPAPVPVPGVKLGLANIVTLVAMKLLGKRAAGAVLGVRVLMGAMFAGSPSTLLFSAAGGALAYLVMCLTVGRFADTQLWIVSALAGIAHNAGQLAACAAVMKTPGVLAYAPVLAASGVLTGIFTGLAAQYVLRALKKAERQKK